MTTPCAFRTQSLAIDDLHRPQEGGGGELVQLFAAILEVQTIGKPDPEGEAARREAILGCHEDHPLDLRGARPADGGEAEDADNGNHGEPRADHLASPVRPGRPAPPRRHAVTGETTA